MKHGLAPVLVAVAVLAGWEAAVVIWNIRPFVLPAPSAILQALWSDGSRLLTAMMATLKVTWLALTAAVISGVGLALVFDASRWIERAILPYAITLQVTPVVAIAPIILIWVGFEHVDRALVIIAWLVAFFPILSNMSAGLRSVDGTLKDLFHVYGARRWQVLLWLKLPACVPYLLTGVKISAGLALIGAVVAEFVAGSGGATGLAWRMLEASNRLQVPKMFACLLLLAVLGITQYYLLGLVEGVLLRHWARRQRDPIS